jgi:hypothetical protein
VSPKQTKNLVVQLRLTEEQYEGIRRAAQASALDPATWMRMSLVRDAAREAPQCWCGTEPGVHPVPHVRGLVGDRCVRATDWKIFAAQLPAQERRALLRRIAEILVPAGPPAIKMLHRTRK